MKGIKALFLGIFGTFVFSWAGLILLPNYQIGHLEPQVVEEEEAYPHPNSGMAERGRHVYVANGCVYCHSQQVRADYAGSDIERKWGVRRSAPRDYLYARPVVLGKMRLGPDLSNIGKRAPVEEEGAPAAASPTPAGATAPQAPTATNPASGASPAPANVAATTSPAPAPSAAADTAASVVSTAGKNTAPPTYSAAWHHRHLYSPRSLVLDSNMPAYQFLYEKRPISGQRATDAINLGEKDTVPEGWEVTPTYDAKCLVAYLMSLDQSHPLNELKATAAAAPAPSPKPAPVKEAK